MERRGVGRHWVSEQRNRTAVDTGRLVRGAKAMGIYADRSSYAHTSRSSERPSHYSCTSVASISKGQIWGSVLL